MKTLIIEIFIAFLFCCAALAFMLAYFDVLVK